MPATEVTASSPRHLNRLERFALVLTAAAVSYQVFLPPVVGLSNNGDFGKIAGVFRLGALLDDVNVTRYAYTNYVFDQKFYYESGFISSESVLLRIALAVNSIVSKLGTFDLRVMGAVHTAVFLLTFYLLLPLVRHLPAAPRGVVLFLVLAAFTDVMYVSYFNSLYMDTAAFLFLLLSTVLFLRALFWQRAADRWWLVVSLVFLITSKTQHYPLGILVTILLAWKGACLTATRSKSFAAISAAVALGATVLSIEGSPKIYPTQGCYSLIFFELLPISSDVDKDLSDLGLDNSYRRYIGTSAYSAGTGLLDPGFTASFAQKMSYARLARFLVVHPSEALRITIYSLGQAGFQRPAFGNFDVSAGQPPLTRSNSFALWSTFKAHQFAEHGVRYLLYAIFLLLGVPALAMVRSRNLPEGIPAAVAMLAVMTVTEMTIASLADALDYQRHFFIFNTLTDLLLISGVAIAVTALNQQISPGKSISYSSESGRPSAPVNKLWARAWKSHWRSGRVVVGRAT